MNYRLTESPSPQEKDEIFRELLRYNLAHLENKDARDLAIFLEDESGNKTAGLIGDTHGNWLEVEYLWVSEKMRGRKIGTELVQKAESFAMERGCKYVFLNTFGFQAPRFYEKLGYVEKFVLKEYPVSGTRHYYTKSLVK
ncbi:Acetyltransferase [Caprobacter fermentans]|uniref:Acetyltransferase n=1 Tax=Caproicibacter fermentans TaxID=2576756 RepID=A0A6N8HV27_9FIRM|nr:GNAT family N-acetyltransferase [Caproicibacter fermentans]MVB09641.1 Acetyltransferase [Caproicibacter fermentans]OCN01509.1 acetyltransferase [Clostridium sp. W14A]QNK40117.1 GNAT family N-acetyltransferase [Caproicibacter fermentans]